MVPHTQTVHTHSHTRWIDRTHSLGWDRGTCRQTALRGASGSVACLTGSAAGKSLVRAYAVALLATGTVPHGAKCPVGTN